MGLEDGTGRAGLIRRLELDKEISAEQEGMRPPTEAACSLIVSWYFGQCKPKTIYAAHDVTE
jgi:hypothetical protein